MKTHDTFRFFSPECFIEFCAIQKRAMERFGQMEFIKMPIKTNVLEPQDSAIILLNARNIINEAIAKERRTIAFSLKVSVLPPFGQEICDAILAGEEGSRRIGTKAEADVIEAHRAKVKDAEIFAEEKAFWEEFKEARIAGGQAWSEFKAKAAVRAQKRRVESQQQQDCQEASDTPIITEALTRTVEPT